MAPNWRVSAAMVLNRFRIDEMRGGNAPRLWRQFRTQIWERYWVQGAERGASGGPLPEDWPVQWIRGTARCITLAEFYATVLFSSFPAYKVFVLD